MLRFIAGLVLISCLFSIGYSVYFYVLKAWISGRDILSKIKRTKINSDNNLAFRNKIKRLNRQQVKTFILDLITLNSKDKLVFIFYAFPISIILSIPSSVFEFNNFTTLLGSLFALITLLGLAKFLGRSFDGHWFDKINFYFLKLSIFVLYSLSFFVGYLQYPNNSVFFGISLLTTIAFSVYFLRSIIDGFDHIGFCVINFFMVYTYDLLAIGLHFGFFYLQNNEIFKLYTNIQQYDSFNIINTLSIIQTGLLNFYTIPTTEYGLDSLINFVPFFEYVFGAVFNVGIIGFFISYIASKIFTVSDKKKRKEIINKS